MANDKKHKAALFARRVRDKKARDTLADSYIRKLIRQKHPEHGFDISKTYPEYVAATKLVLAIRRVAWGRNTPEMDEAIKAYIAASNKKAGSP